MKYVDELPPDYRGALEKEGAAALTAGCPATRCSAGFLATYPDDARDILLSGWIAGEDKLTRKAAAVATTYGKGRIVLLGFRPQHRGQTHATFPMIFNALYWGRVGPGSASLSPAVVGRIVRDCGRDARVPRRNPSREYSYVAACAR
ncbi:MAG TPA: hypothetical protein VGQ21_05945 [Thermoanaerobaculia bacterium]|jgi:hypothetical protein|nr:hypothetical protein [Thermoanaerobaculia bacterium]